MNAPSLSTSNESDIPIAIGSGTFRVLGVDVRCYTLSDGTAIVDAESMAALIEAMEAPEGRDIGELEALLAWQQEHVK